MLRYRQGMQSQTATASAHRATAPRGLPPLPLGVRIMDLYARISVDYDGTTRSCDGQIAEALDAFEQVYAPQGWVLGMVFKDPYLSGWKPTVIRKDFVKLMTRLSTGVSHGVIFYDVQRFTRKPREAEALLEAVEQHGTVVHSTALEAPYPLATPDGRKQFRDAANAAAYESDKTSSRSRRGNRLKAASRQHLHTFRPFAMDGWLPAPEGWTKGMARDRVSPEQLEAERALVRDAARRILKGVPITTLVREYNRRELTTLRGCAWTPVTLRQVLERPSLAGLVEHHGRIVGVSLAVEEGKEEPALDRETWERLMAVFAGRRRGRPPVKALLSGHARCGRCGARLSSRPKYPVRADGTTARQYYCQRKHDGTGCGHLFIDAEMADEVVRRAVIVRLGDPAHAELLRRRAVAADPLREKLLGEISEGEATAAGLGAKLAAGQMSLERYDAIVEPLDARLAGARARLAELVEVPAEELALRDAAAAWDEAVAQDDIEARRAMVRTAFPHLVIRPGVKGTNSGPERFDWTGESLANVVALAGR